MDGCLLLHFKNKLLRPIIHQRLRNKDKIKRYQLGCEYIGLNSSGLFVQDNLKMVSGENWGSLFEDKSSARWFTFQGVKTSFLFSLSGGDHTKRNLIFVD